MRFFAAAASLALLTACASRAPEKSTPVAASAIAPDERTVEIRFTEKIDASSIDTAKMHIIAPLARPIAELAITSAEVRDTLLILQTAEQEGGVLYAANVGDVRFEGIDRADFSSQINFRGYGRTTAVISLDTRGFVAPSSLTALATVDAATGAYTDELDPYPLAESALAGVYTATISVRIDPERTYAARAVGPADEEAGQLTRFTVASRAPAAVKLNPLLPRVPEFTAPIDPIPGDGFAPVRIIFDDRFARELAHPELRSSIDAAGRFDLAAARLDPLLPTPEKQRVYETTINVAVDPNRTLSGTTPETFPYVVFLVESREEIQQRGANFEMLAENPQVIVIPVGNPSLVPVRFRIDAKTAVLEPNLSRLGKYPNEGIFLTGEFPSSEDALGRLAADAFTGGERSTLEMKERPDAPGIYEKTIFMPPNRPYGWKVVRCPTGQGCAELNRHVLSSGRAFPTVMKNLVTANIDAATSPEVRVLDPEHLGEYSGAQVSSAGTEMPSAAVMFKQEVPDLVVTVGTTPVTTQTYVVGTWRDVNIPDTPEQIIAMNLTLDLSMFDYDDGTQGKSPLVRDIVLPDEPGRPMRPRGEPMFTADDGQADSSARQLPAAQGVLPLWVGWNEAELYVATSPARAGRDHFIVVSLEPPAEARAAHWAKGGTEVASARQIFLAMEGNGAFQGWFRRGETGTTDTQIMGAGVNQGVAAVLEGSFDPVRAGVGAFGDRVWIAVVAFETADGGALDPAAQNPQGNGDFNVDAAEFRELELSAVRSE